MKSLPHYVAEHRLIAALFILSIGVLLFFLYNAVTPEALTLWTVVKLLGIAPAVLLLFALCGVAYYHFSEWRYLRLLTQR